MVLFVVLFSSMGMEGSGCTNVTIPGNGNGNGGGSGNCSSTGQKPVITANDHVIGDANAPVTVVEYSDIQCPFCGRFARESLPAIIRDYVDTGKIRFVFRHFPLTQIHPDAQAAAEASECADDQGKFFEFHDLCFEDQNDLSTAALQGHADTLSLDRPQFDACAAGTSKAQRVQQDITSGTALGVASTPTFFVEDERVAGFQTAEELGAVIDRKLNCINGG